MTFMWLDIICATIVNEEKQALLLPSLHLICLSRLDRTLYTLIILFSPGFSAFDILLVKPLQDKVLDIFEGRYNWTVVKHTIDCAQL